MVIWKAKSAVDHFVTLQVLVNKVSISKIWGRVSSLLESDVHDTAVEQFMGSPRDWSFLRLWLCWPGYLLQGAWIFIDFLYMISQFWCLEIDWLFQWLTLRYKSEIFNQGMGLASCNNALGYWHYPGEVLKCGRNISTELAKVNEITQLTQI